jgi:hypothetical protein
VDYNVAIVVFVPFAIIVLLVVWMGDIHGSHLSRENARSSDRWNS